MLWASLGSNSRIDYNLFIYVSEAKVINLEKLTNS